MWSCISKFIDKCRNQSNDKAFSKNSHNDLDLEPRTLKVEFARDIIIPNICMNLHLKPLMNVGTRVVTKFFQEIAIMILTVLSMGQTLYPLHNLVVRVDNKRDNMSHTNKKVTSMQVRKVKSQINLLIHECQRFKSVGAWCSGSGRAHRCPTVGFLLLQHFSYLLLSSPPLFHLHSFDF